MQLKYHMVTIEDLVPQNHFLRKVEATLDWTIVNKVDKRNYRRNKFSVWLGDRP